MKPSELAQNATPLPPEYFGSVTTCLVLAPHADDESLGCGGLISLLRAAGKDVYVIFTTDSSFSHPHSKKYPPTKLAALRKEEALGALAVLGVTAGNVFFLNKPDGALPSIGNHEFTHNAEQLHLLIILLRPDLVLVPYEKDPHTDHRATWQMLMYAHQKKSSFRILEYLIWLHERGKEEEMPDKNCIRFVDISPWQAQKEKAIRQHISQTTNLIDDDPEGFTLSAGVLQHFSTGKEYYVDRQL